MQCLEMRNHQVASRNVITVVINYQVDGFGTGILGNSGKWIVETESLKLEWLFSPIYLGTHYEEQDLPKLRDTA
jgi:hypothetical protein